MSNTLILNQPYPNVGLDTMTFTIPSSGLYNVKVDLTENPPSGISIVVNNNAAPVFTAPSVSSTQGAIQFKYFQLFAANDVVTVVLSSALAIDKQLNTVKSIISISQGVA